MAKRCSAAKNRCMSEQSTSDPQTGMDKFYAVMRSIGIRRRTDDKWIAGVCSGLADRLGVDPVIVRAGLILLCLLGGAGITIYLVAWALLPNDRDEIVAQKAFRDGDSRSIVVIILASLGLFGGSAFAGPWWSSHSGWGFPWALALTGLLIWWLVKRSGDHDRRVGSLQLGTLDKAGASPTTNGPIIPQTQVLPQTLGAPQTQVAPQTQGAPQTYVVPKKNRRRSGGPLMALLALGLALATYGSLSWAGSAFGWTGDHRTIALAGSLAAIGLLLVVLGVAGWRAGFVAFLAVILAVSAWTSAVLPAGFPLAGRVGDTTWAPTSATEGLNYHLGVGSGVLDLSKLPTQAKSTATIPASVGMGELKVVVPRGLTVEVVGHVGLGEILLPTDPGSNGQSGSDVSRSMLIGNGPTEVVVNAGVGIGQLTVVKE
jgi:phage shock protein PspC (stress-responsive transcriptional regulator)